MEQKQEPTRVFGVAKIISYEVTFDSVSYTIRVRECSEESLDRVDTINDFVINMIIPFTERYSFLYWMRNPAFNAMKESWLSGEDDCYFEHASNERAALMTLNGSVVLIPVVNL